jgi:aminoglycoside phosphotransferase (APT) family kinase protein
MQRIQGVILRRDPPEGLGANAETARQLSEAFVDNLARLHGLDYTAIGLADLGKPQGYLDRQVKGWIDRYRGSQTYELPEVESISVWLNERKPGDASYALIHNDYKYDNIVLDPADITKIVGVLDWEMCTIGDPLTDLGTAFGVLGRSARSRRTEANPLGPYNIGWHYDAVRTCLSLRSNHWA